MEEKNSKDLVKFRKSFLNIIKEKLENKRQELIESKMDPKWLEEMYKANIELFQVEEIDLSDEELIQKSHEIAKNNEVQKVNVEDIKFDEINFSGSKVITKNENKENVLKSPMDLKEAYSKIKNGEYSFDDYSDADLLKIYSVMVEELQMTENLVDDEEIEKLEKENEALRKEIEKLEENDSNS